MIVVDTSVWIGHLRDLPTTPVGKLRALESFADVLVGDFILLEILQGARDERDASRIGIALRQFPIATMLGPDLAVAAARHYRALRGLGITVRNTVDLMIATFCIAQGHRLLHDDRDFEPFVEHLGLRSL